MRCFLIVLVIALAFLLTKGAVSDNQANSLVTAHYETEGPTLSLSVPDALDFPMDINAPQNILPFTIHATSSQNGYPWQIEVNDSGEDPLWYLRNEETGVNLTNPISLVNGGNVVPDSGNRIIATGSSTNVFIPIQLEQVPDPDDNLTEIYTMMLQFTISASG